MKTLIFCEINFLTDFSRIFNESNAFSLFTNINPSFLKYWENIGIFLSSFFSMKIEPGKREPRKKVSHADWWLHATTNEPDSGIFSTPFISYFIPRINFESFITDFVQKVQSVTTKFLVNSQTGEKIKKKNIVPA